MTQERAGSRSFSVGPFRPDDAPGVAGLFRTVYGDAYPAGMVYDPAALVAAFEAGDNIPAVARAADGGIVGYLAFYRSAPNKAAYEGGQGLVHPDFRAEGVFSELGRYAFNDMAREIGAESIFGEAVCNHLHTQKTCASLGWIETAIEVELMPKEAYAAEKSAPGRVSTLFMGKVMEGREVLVYLPPRYEEAMRFLYEGSGDRPDYRAASGGPPDGPTRVTTQVFDSAGVARMTVHEAGGDFGDVIRQKEAELDGKGLAVIQVWLKLSRPSVGACVDILRSRGYFLGGLLPRWFEGSDGLLMQRLSGEPAWENVHLYSKRAERILEIIRNDRMEPPAKGEGQRGR